MDIDIWRHRSPRGDREESELETRIMERARPCLKQLKSGGRKLGETAKMLLETTMQDVMARAGVMDGEKNLEDAGGKKNYAVITGASSGIGLEFARRLSLEGYPLILIARRRDRLEDLRRELGTECLLLPADLSRHEDLVRLCEDLMGRRIDVFINNAGFGVAGPFMATDLLREVNMIDVNVTAQHVLFKYILHRMEAEGGGYILNVASSAGLFPAGPFMSGYYATKAYMTSLTRGVVEELRQAGSSVYVGCLCPGPVNTEFNDVANVTFALPGISAAECVDYAMKMMARRKVMIVPGKELRAAVFGQRFLPTALTVRITAAQQRKKLGAEDFRETSGSGAVNSFAESVKS